MRVPELGNEVLETAVGEFGTEKRWAAEGDEGRGTGSAWVESADEIPKVGRLVILEKGVSD